MFPLRKSATHSTAEKPTVLAHATNPLGHDHSAGEAPIAVQLFAPALPGCTLVGKGPPQIDRFADGAEPGEALKLPPELKSHEATIDRANGERDGEAVPDGVIVGDAVPDGVADGDAPTEGVCDSDIGTPPIVNEHTRNVPWAATSDEKRQQKLGALDAFCARTPVDPNKTETFNGIPGLRCQTRPCGPVMECSKRALCAYVTFGVFPVRL